MPRFIAIIVFFQFTLAIQATHADDAPAQLVVATWNVEWLFDDHLGDNFSDLSKSLSAPSAAEWKWRLNAVAETIAKIRPTIIALQEIENRQVLNQLVKSLRDQHGIRYHVAYVEGTDTYTEQDVAVLTQSGLIDYGCRVQTSEDYASGKFHNVSRHILVHFRWHSGDQELNLTMMNVHLRATAEGAAIRAKQCHLLRQWIDDLQARGEQLIVLGDLNTEEQGEHTDPASDLGILCLGGPGTKDDLTDLNRYLSKSQRTTHLTGKQLDHILVSPPWANAMGQGMVRFRKIETRKDLVVRGKGPDRDHWDGFYQIARPERDLSDHYPVVARFEIGR